MINIYGKGGHAKMIASLLKTSTSFYNDNDYIKAKSITWFIGVGDNVSRKNISINLNGKNFININSGIYVCNDVKLGVGILIAPGAIIQNNVSIGNHSIINTSSSVDHDCMIGEFCHIAPNATLCGNVSIGNCTLIGAGSVILPNITIGSNCIIGAGSIVTKNIPSNTIAYGNPALIQKL
jgi:sugar O-acyltransferase (sialic acid O-acetyltransferase NeuD family)